jgi:quinol monooxygenase YgiN
MYIIIWKYRVKPEKQRQFEKIYAPDGDWAGLFRKGAGYAGTDLLSEEGEPRTWVTIDHWDSKEAYEGFLSQHENEYKTLDVQCEDLMEAEVLLGRGQVLFDRHTDQTLDSGKHVM